MMEHLYEAFLSFISYNPSSPLLFTSLEFWLFLAAVLIAYIPLHRGVRGRNIFLLIVSLFFYYKSCGAFSLLVVLSTLINYWLGAEIGSNGKSRLVRRLYLTVGVTLNLGLLGYFKYAGFFASIFMPDASGEGGFLSLFRVVLPIGISFYTFQAVSYLVDIYRGQVAPLKSVVDFGVYLAFFPSLVAGPIVRASEFIPQLSGQYQLSVREASHALYLILLGLLKKVVLSDYIALNLVDRVFASPASYSGVENLLAVYGYTLQIYCDFSGYTDIAIGLALLLGFRLSINFNLPYRSKTLTEFWHRWHISLSTWLRDYLYIPLGGSRHGVWVMFGALFATMLLGGLWHGARYTFIIWGGLHGLGLVVSKLLDRMLPKTRAMGFIRGVFAFHFVAAVWVLFRAPSLGEAGLVFHQIGSAFNVAHIPMLFGAYTAVLWLMLAGYFMHWMPVRWGEQVRGLFIGSGAVVRFILTLAIALVILAAQSSELQPFIYFDF